MANKLTKAIQNPELVLEWLVTHSRLCRKMSDKRYISFLYRIHFRRKINLDNPQTFSEKLQWLKLYDRKPEYTRLVDKAAVKDYVAGIIGKEYVIPTIGVWERPEDIEWNALPERFVLKTTHGGGNAGVVICRNKASFDRNKAIKKLNRSLKQDIYRSLREWPYKNVPRRIIAEQYIAPAPNHNDLPDYKFFCFNGEPKFCQVITGRDTKMCVDFFDKDWNHQPFHEPKKSIFADVFPSKPENYEMMLKAAAQLANGKAFSRIDFYDIGEKVYFGEITFFPTSGMGGFTPNDYDSIIGQMISLPGEKRGVIIKQLQNSEFEITQPDLPDYKFFCFNGTPKYCQVVSGRGVLTCFDFFDLDWKHQPFREPKRYPLSSENLQCPKNFELMCNLAGKLASDKVFSRIDFYNINGKVLFGEITLFPTSGFGGFDPHEWDYTFGSYIKLPEITQTV